MELSELELTWPPTLFAAEAHAMLDAGYRSVDDLGLLLTEAFHRDRGSQLLQEVEEAERRSSSGSIEAFGEPGPPLTAVVDLVTDLANRATELPRHVPRLYYSRRRRPAPYQGLSPTGLRGAVAAEVAALANRGYFEDAFGSGCCDSHDDLDSEGQRQLAAATGNGVRMWLLRPQEDGTGIETQWTEEQFFDFVEALHDLVARPRRRWFHFYRREWDYTDFACRPGQAVYRWRVNELLDRSQVPLRLAETGSDVGLLVQAAGDGRDDLIERVLEAPAGGNGDEVGHEVLLFRGRGATREAKRSAIVTLYGVLERHRPLLKQQLPSKDEAALFEIANQYDLRHRGTSQRADYDTAFLDWLFWWYLATVELTDRLLARQDAA